MYEDILYTLQIPNCPFFFSESLPLLFFDTNFTISFTSFLKFLTDQFISKRVLWSLAVDYSLVDMLLFLS